MTQNLLLYDFLLLDEVYDVISSRNVGLQIIEGCPVVNFEVASSNSFRDIPKISFLTATEADIDDSIKQKRIRVLLN